MPDTTPTVTVFWNSPSGLPIATTVAPTGTSSLFASGATFRFARAGICSTAMSVLVVSRPDFDRLLEEAPSLTRTLLTGMARRIQELDDRI